MAKELSKQDRKRFKRMLQDYSVLVSRAQLAARLGLQYGSDREIYEALGYKTELTYEDFSVRYLRQDIAKAIIDKPVKATWSGKFNVIETADEKETQFETAWNELSKRLKLKSIFRRLDTLTGLGKWGALLMGYDDVGNVEVWKEPVTKGRKLLYVKPFGEGNAEIDKYVDNTKDERYGLPEQYKITMTFPGTKTSKNYFVHYSRILHVAGEQLDDDTEGLPRLQVVFNRLMDLEKLVGGSAEMFWRGARPGYQGVLQDDFTLTEELEDDMQDQVDEWENKLRRIFLLQGIKLEALAQQVADPENHVHAQLQMLSAETGIPLRILIGSERGELASSQDIEAWKELIQARREEYAQPMIVDPFVETCIQNGVLPQPGKDGYDVEWEDLWSPSDKDKADVGKTRSEALKNYTNAMGGDAVLPPKSFLKHGMGLSDEDIELIEEEQEAFLEEEEARQRELE